MVHLINDFFFAALERWVRAEVFNSLLDRCGNEPGRDLDLGVLLLRLLKICLFVKLACRLESHRHIRIAPILSLVHLSHDLVAPEQP